MALVRRSNDLIKVIAFQDSSVTVSREVYEQYLVNLDESLLQLSGEPTRFVMKTVLGFDQQKALDDSMMKVDTASKMVQVAYSTLPVIRYCLVGIECPSDQPVEQRFEFKKDSDGLASKDLVAELNSFGLCADLVTARSHATANVQPVQKK